MTDVGARDLRNDTAGLVRRAASGEEIVITARRLVTLDSVSEMAVLHIDEQVARHWALLRAELAQSGRRINVNDIWIAATAIAHDLPVVTQDTDFDAIAEIGGLSIVRV